MGGDAHPLRDAQTKKHTPAPSLTAIGPNDDDAGKSYATLPPYSDDKELVTPREPSLDISAYARGPLKAYRAGPRPMAAGSFAYEAPSEQTRYDGAGARVLDRDFGED